MGRTVIWKSKRIYFEWSGTNDGWRLQSRITPRNLQSYCSSYRGDIWIRGATQSIFYLNLEIRGGRGHSMSVAWTVASFAIIRVRNQEWQYRHCSYYSDSERNIAANSSILKHKDMSRHLMSDTAPLAPHLYCFIFSESLVSYSYA